MRGWLVVFAKEPVQGRVKTRLSPPLSPAEACQLYRCLLDDALAESVAACGALGLEAVVAVDPPGAVAAIASLAPAGCRAIAQGAGELGARMSGVVHQGAAAGAELVLLRGSDSPCLDRETLAAAVAELSRCEVVIAPDRDGGYNLVGLAGRALVGRVVEGLFDHPMSTPTVLRDTRRRAEQMGLGVRELALGFDIDRFEDLRWLGEARARAGPTPCPKTLRFLDEHELWPSPSGRMNERIRPNC